MMEVGDDRTGGSGGRFFLLLLGVPPPDLEDEDPKLPCRRGGLLTDAAPRDASGTEEGMSCVMNCALLLCSYR